jgi:hypothetical protein
MELHRFKKGDDAYIWNELHRDNHIVGKIVHVKVWRAKKGNRCQIMLPSYAVNETGPVVDIDESAMFKTADELEEHMVERYKRFIKSDLVADKRKAEEYREQAGSFIRRLFDTDVEAF